MEEVEWRTCYLSKCSLSVDSNIPPANMPTRKRKTASMVHDTANPDRQCAISMSGKYT